MDGKKLRRQLRLSPHKQIFPGRVLIRDFVEVRCRKAVAVGVAVRITALEFLLVAFQRIQKGFAGFLLGFFFVAEETMPSARPWKYSMPLSYLSSVHASSAR